MLSKTPLKIQKSKLRHLSKNYRKFNILGFIFLSSSKVLVHKVLSEAILSTLSGYVAWVNTKHLEQDNAVLLELLCFLLEDDELRMSAAECLELIVSRKVIFALLIFCYVTTLKTLLNFIALLN